jgi:hypothetical protein
VSIEEAQADLHALDQEIKHLIDITAVLGWDQENLFCPRERLKTGESNWPFLKGIPIAWSLRTKWPRPWKY